MRKCLHCSAELIERFKIKFCSNQCQQDYKHKVFIEKWKNADKKGNLSISTKNICGHLKRYLFDKYNSQCSQCGWHKKHPITGRVPLEVDHIDGNSENNSESNLQLLCPNCHALTPFFRNLNRGKGRAWRKEKYLKNA